MCNPEHKVCPRCQKEFDCKPGNITECQCFGLQLSIEQRAYIEQRYVDCLCRECLLTLQKDIELLKEKFIFR